MSVTIPTPEELRRLRLQAGLTQKELAKRAGLSQSLIARIESGDIDPRLSTLRKILSAIPFKESFKTASQVMCSPVIYVTPEDSIREAVDLMEKHGISQLPVINGSKIVGSVREDSLIREIFQSKEPNKIFDKKVKEVMDEAFPTVSPSTSIVEVLSAFLYAKPAVLVVERGKICGIITKIDIIKAMRT
ncbi:MAG: CBS domain-containing protein [Candidatus Bathyarchaeia archaeon]